MALPFNINKSARAFVRFVAEIPQEAYDRYAKVRDERGYTNVSAFLSMLDVWVKDKGKNPK